MSAIQPTQKSDAGGPTPYRLAVAAYHRMIEAGVFAEGDRVGRIEGELHALPPINAGHAGKNKRLNRFFSRFVQDRAIVAVQDPLTLPEHSEPEPDLMLLRPRDDFYERTHPSPSDALLVIEVADTSLRYDPNIKIPLYAAHGVPETWLLDLTGRRIEVYRDPGPEGYRQILLPDRDPLIAPLLLPEVRFQVAELGS